MEPLPRSFYERDTEAVAKELLGKMIVRRARGGLTAAAIVETEAYLQRTDPACHAYRGMTKRNATMFGPPGHLYVYSIHARWCMNVVTEREGIGDAVLIRAAEPVRGVTLMRDRRQREADVDLTRGPARLCQAMDVDGALDGFDLTRGTRVWICDQPTSWKMGVTGVSKRIGISSNQEAPLRFFVHENRFVSGPKWLNHPATAEDQR